MTKQATFAAGCFWSIEHKFSKVPGVLSTGAGYMGGHNDNPTYKDICTGTTNHAEVETLTYDPAQVSYDRFSLSKTTSREFDLIIVIGKDLVSKYNMEEDTLEDLNNARDEEEELLINSKK